jgi:hypothetical protein
MTISVEAREVPHSREMGLWVFPPAAAWIIKWWAVKE